MESGKTFAKLKGKWNLIELKNGQTITTECNQIESILPHLFLSDIIYMTNDVNSYGHLAMVSSVDSSCPKLIHYAVCQTCACCEVENPNETMKSKFVQLLGYMPTLCILEQPMYAIVDAYKYHKIMRNSEDPFEQRLYVARAKLRLGNKGYNLYYENCESFLLDCSGLRSNFSSQVAAAAISVVSGTILFALSMILSYFAFKISPLLLVLYIGFIFIIRKGLRSVVQHLNEKGYDQLIKMIGILSKPRARRRLKKLFDKYARIKKSKITSATDIIEGVEILDQIFEEYFAPPFLFAVFAQSTWDTMIRRYVMARMAAFKISHNRTQAEDVGSIDVLKQAAEALQQLCLISPAFICATRMQIIKPEWLAKLHKSGVNITVSLAKALNNIVTLLNKEPDLQPGCIPLLEQLDECLTKMPEVIKCLQSTGALKLKNPDMEVKELLLSQSSFLHV